MYYLTGYITIGKLGMGDIVYIPLIRVDGPIREEYREAPSHTMPGRLRDKSIIFISIQS